jgi:hypothetical protein
MVASTPLSSFGCDGFSDIEDLAAGQSNANVSASKAIRIIVMALAFLWVLLLITAAEVKQHTWFLLTIGGVGMLLNIYVAGHGRHTQCNSLPILFKEAIGNIKVMRALYEFEETYPRLGSSILSVFFPGKLELDEQQRWVDYSRTARARESEIIARIHDQMP